jgi:hypothetical protein
MAMRVGTSVALLLGFALSLGACSRGPIGGIGSKAAPEPQAAPSTLARGSAPAQSGASTGASDNAVDLRRVVKKASLALEVKVPSDALSAATRIAEREGGFVSSTSRAVESTHGRQADGPVTLVLRVPSARFGSALDGLRRLGLGTGSEDVTTEDVSEEFIDLDARIRNQRELESQFLQILKQATKVEEALHVQREIATVRTEIDRMQGRRNFLDRETSLSTITLTLTRPRPLVTASFSDFGTSVARAASDSVNVGAGIVTGSIRVLGVLLPLALLIGLPLGWLTRFGLRRLRRTAVVSEAAR